MAATRLNARKAHWLRATFNVEDEYFIERDDMNYAKHVACLRCRLFPRSRDFLGAL